MNLRLRHLALAAAAVSAAASADPWLKIDELPGGIAVEVDQDTEVEALDGVRLVERATFRKQLPTGTMETAIEIDCAHEEAKIRGVRMTSEGKTLAENVDPQAQFAPVNPGSAEAVYYKELCGKEISAESPADKGADAPAGADGGE